MKAKGYSVVGVWVCLSLLGGCTMVPHADEDKEDDSKKSQLVLTGSRIPHKVDGKVIGTKIISAQDAKDDLRTANRMPSQRGN
jgi:starvation-inducible outer membrane lipoprotein